VFEGEADESILQRQEKETQACSYLLFSRYPGGAKNFLFCTKLQANYDDNKL
jgi:hypothetical protein